jgi:hypothetical protein
VGQAFALQPCHQMQRHVDAGANAGGCHDLALIDETRIVQHSHTGERAAQALDAAPVGRDPIALQQTSPAQQEGSCADGGGELGLGTLGTNPVDQPRVIDFAARTPAARYEQQVDRWMVVDGIVWLHLQPACGAHQPGALGQGKDGEGRDAAGGSADLGGDGDIASP